MLYRVIITKVPDGAYAMYWCSRYRQDIAHESCNEIMIRLPLFYEGSINIELHIPEKPDRWDPDASWQFVNQNKPNKFIIHTDDFKDRKYVISDHMHSSTRAVFINRERKRSKLERKLRG